MRTLTDDFCFFEQRCWGFPLGSQQEKKDPLVLARLLDLSSFERYFVIEYDQKRKIAFCEWLGLAPFQGGLDGGRRELRLYHGEDRDEYQIDRDFEPCAYSECKQDDLNFLMCKCLSNSQLSE